MQLKLSLDNVKDAEMTLRSLHVLLYRLPSDYVAGHWMATDDCIAQESIDSEKLAQDTNERSSV